MPREKKRDVRGGKKGERDTIFGINVHIVVVS